MEEANNSYSNQAGVSSDGVSAPTKWNHLFPEIKDYTTVSMVRNKKRPLDKQLTEKNLPSLKKHNKGVATKMNSHMLSAEESIRALEAELNSEKGLVRMLLQEKVSRLETDVADRDHEIGNMKLELDDARESFLKEKTEIVAECESKVENVTRECDAKMELYEGKQKECSYLIAQLKVELSQRCGELEKLNVELGAKKSECETLMKEKNNLVAQMQQRGDTFTTNKVTFTNTQ